ncbi:MAG: hypothetical protein ACYDCQ_05510 [Dehalococcoidia bacterium]
MLQYTEYEPGIDRLDGASGPQSSLAAAIEEARAHGMRPYG